ncbi:MAG: PAS domain S-box protein, partial [Candidatus Hodarchaeales archaeon]
MSRVLLVDDNLDHMAIATKFLERLNPDFEVDSVPSAQEALQKLQEQQFDVLISDYQMPEMDGLKLLETVRNQGNDIPFVMFTGRGREEVAMQALNLGANHYLMKGGDLTSLYGELAHTISQLIAHQQTSLALQESEEKYHALISNIPVVTWMSDSEGGTSFISPNIEKVYGFTPAEIYEKGEELWFGRIHPAEAENVKAKYQALFAAKEPFEAEYRIQRKDGKWIWLHDRAITIIEREGHSHAYGVFSDITKRKNLQAALQNQRDNAQRYLDISEALIVQLNRDGNITVINKRGCDLLEYNENELIGKNWFDTCLPPDIREEIRDISRKLMASDLKLAEHYENPIMTKHGEKKHIYWHNAFLRNAKNEIVGIISSGIDITGRKQAEETLRESEERFRVTFAHAPFGIGIFEPNGKLIDVNPAAQRMVGYTKEELISPSIGNIIPSTHAHLEQNLFKELIDGKRGYYQLEQPYKRKDNKQIWGRVNASLARDDDGRPLFAISMLEDITDHKRAEEALRESEERFRTIFQKSNEGIVLVEITEEGHLSYFIEANEAFCQLTGHSQAELTKFVPRDLVAPEEFERLRKAGIIGTWFR